MNQSRFPEWENGLDNYRLEAEKEHQRIQSAIEDAKKLPVEDYVDRMQEIDHGIV